MHLKLALGLFALVLALPATLRADHTGGVGGVSQLYNDANRLQSIVCRSHLRFQVQRAVAQFTSEARAYYQCEMRRSNGGMGTWDHGGGDSCEYNEQRLQQAFYSVDRFLYDTEYDLPYVYRAYLQVRDDMQGIR